MTPLSRIHDATVAAFEDRMTFDEFAEVSSRDLPELIKDPEAFEKGLALCTAAESYLLALED